MNVSNQQFASALEQLRYQAEALVLPSQNLDSSTNQNLLHELQVHQIELEMQNEQLRQVQGALEESRDRYVDLYEFAPVGYLSISAQGMIDALNLKAASMLGIERKQLIKQVFSKLVTDEARDYWRRQFTWMKSLAAGEEHSFEIRLNQNNGYVFDAQLSCLRVNDQDAGSKLRITLIDITARKQAEADQRIAAIAFESQNGMMVTDANRVILRVNKAFTDITGYSAAEAVGKTPKLLSSNRHNIDFYQGMKEDLHNVGFWEGEIYNRHKNGSIYLERLSIKAVKNADGILTHYVGSISDITKNREAEDQLQHLAFYDALTSLPNRRLLQDRLKQAIAFSMRTGHEGAVLFLDLDHFKTLNDTLGHDFGDMLLQQVATRLTAYVREGDTVARLGGDEYVMVLESLSKQSIEAAAEVEAIAKKILHNLNQPYVLQTKEYQCTASIGATLFNQHELDVAELLKQADIALFQAKKLGRNTFRFFDPQMQIIVNARAEIEHELKKAVEKNQFHLYYQIQVDESAQPIGAEALIRWLHPVRGLVSPIDFIPLAEESGLILTIGQWVLNAACIQLKLWEKSAITSALTLSVNLSARQLHQADFVEQVLATVQRHAINPNKLRLELTESMLVDDVSSIITSMTALTDIGIRFELDDFGTGYSSLQYLKNLPLYQLKIDQSFVRDITNNSNDQAIVGTIISMAENLGLEVIAEGVETEAQRLRLKDKGCTHYQGYLFSKPLPIDEFEALLSKV